MKLEIKQRIEQIKAGQVPDGYKRTKIGVVPAEWNICKLKDVLEKQTMKNKDNIVKNVLTNSAAKGIVSQTDFFEKQIANSDNTSGYYIVKNGYFVYNPRISVSAPCGPFNKYYGEKDGIMSPLYTVYKYKDASEYYSEFLSLYFSGSSWYSYMNSIANYGARSDRMNVTSADMDNMPFPYPPLAEQEKIVKILSTQDRIIELYQRKIEELQKMKKIYLSKMFPKKGENVPEWRFPQFTGAWEQRKLGEVAIYRRGSFPQPYGKSEWYDGDGAMPFVQVADVSDEMNLVEDTKQKISILAQPMSVFAEKNSVLVTLQGSIGRVAITQYGAFVDRTVLIFEKYKAEIDKTFWAYIIKQKFIDEARKAPGGTIKTITKEALSDFELSIPNYQEQKQIGAYFRNLDNLITLHQRKLEENKKYKKALMQLLLTGIVRI